MVLMSKKENRNITFTTTSFANACQVDSFTNPK